MSMMAGISVLSISELASAYVVFGALLLEAARARVGL